MYKRDRLQKIFSKDVIVLFTRWSNVIYYKEYQWSVIRYHEFGHQNEITNSYLWYNVELEKNEIIIIYVPITKAKISSRSLGEHWNPFFLSQKRN